MTNQKPGSNRDLWMLGAVLTVPFIFLSGPFAGYVVSKFILMKYFDVSTISIPICVTLGVIGSGLQVYRLIQAMLAWDQKKNS